MVVGMLAFGGRWEHLTGLDPLGIFPIKLADDHSSAAKKVSSLQCAVWPACVCDVPALMIFCSAFVCPKVDYGCLQAVWVRQCHVSHLHLQTADPNCHTTAAQLVYAKRLAPINSSCYACMRRLSPAAGGCGPSQAGATQPAAAA